MLEKKEPRFVLYWISEFLEISFNTFCLRIARQSRQLIVQITQSDNRQRFCTQLPVDQMIGPRALVLNTATPLNCATKDVMDSFCHRNSSKQPPKKQSLSFTLLHKLPRIINMSI